MKAMPKAERAKHRDAIAKRRAVVETGLRSVVDGYTSALFVWGPPGLGKSHILTCGLDSLLGRKWRHHTAHSTPKALVLMLLEEPSAIHLFEDCETMLKTELTASILRAACGSPNDRERIVTYETSQQQLRGTFTGGIIFATNQNLSKVSGPLQGVASRFRPIKWDLSREERIAMILDLADDGFNRASMSLTPKECKEVAVELIDLVDSTQFPVQLDLRLYTEHALPAFAQCKDSGGGKWQDLLNAKISGTGLSAEETREEKAARLDAIALKINQDGGSIKEKAARWQEHTGLGQAIYYRHLRRGLASK
jgi:hypothetical protein